MSARRAIVGAQLPAEAGFTLIELMVATAVVAFLSLLLFGGMRFGTRVWEKAETATSGENSIRSAQEVLTEELSNIYPLFVVTTPQDRYVEFDGEAQRVTFLAPAKKIQGAMEVVTIAAQPQNGTLALRVSAKAELAPSLTIRPAQTVIGGLQTFNIAYFGAEAPGAPAEWTNVWQNQRILPMLIRIRATFAKREKWPDLVIAPRIDVDEACVFDQLTKNCQGR
jgi:general secretion pathway protein J